MLLKNTRKINSGDVVSQFNQFKKQVEQSGQTPQQILNGLLSSGQISKNQLDNVVNMAKQFSHLIK